MGNLAVEVSIAETMLRYLNRTKIFGIEVESKKTFKSADNNRIHAESTEN